MNTSIPRRGPVRLLAALAGGLSLVLALSAAAAPSSPQASATSIPGGLSAVSFSSPSDGWAVGFGPTRTLILHWNGTAWTQVPSPTGGFLTGVYARSSSDAWAVGFTGSSTVPGTVTLILHWNGSKWTQVPSPSREVVDGSFLQSVTTVAPTRRR